MSNSLNDQYNDKNSTLADFIYNYYKDNYVCTSLAKNTWYKFDKHRWVIIEYSMLSEKIINDCVNELCNTISQYTQMMQQSIEKEQFITKIRHTIELRSKFNTLKFKKLLLSRIATKLYDSKFYEKLDDNPFLIGFNNGIYDLKNKCFRDGKANDYVSLSTGYDYKEHSLDDPKLKEIEEFFKKVQRDDDMREYILTLIASYLEGINKSQRIIIWHGLGSNGISTTLDLIRYIFGDYFGVLPNTILTRKMASFGAPEFADKKGKRFLIIQELDHNDTINIGMMKALASSDTITGITHSDVYSYTPQFKLVLPCNFLPKLPFNDGGIWMRLRVATWESEFVDKPSLPHQYIKDPNLLEKLRTCKEALMWLLLNVYYSKYLEEGLKEPQKVRAHTARYKNDIDYIGQFLSTEMEITNNNNDSEAITNIYSSLKCWYHDAYSSKICSTRMDLHNYLVNNWKLASKNGIISGIRFRQDAHIYI